MHPVTSFLKTHGIRLNTDLGQHFLINESVLDRIVEAANIQPKDTIVEIGAGIGILTRELVKKAQRVTAIEIDAKLIPLLKEFTANPTHLTIINGNALHISFPTEPYKIVANIPYHITSPLLRHAFLESSSPPQSLTLGIIEADSFIDDVLKKMDLRGEHMADRMEQLTRMDLKSADNLWKAHRVRNDLVHTSGFTLSKGDAERALQYYEDFLKEVGMLG